MSSDGSRTTKRVIILGAGGHARVLVDAISTSNDVEIAGLVLPASSGPAPYGLSILGDDDHLLSTVNVNDFWLVNGVGSSGDTGPRERLYARMAGAGFRFLTIVHSFAKVSRRASLGEGSQVMAGAIIQAGAIVGCNAIINTGAIIDHDCTVEDHAHVAPGVTLSGAVRIGVGAHIGPGATIIQGVSIGARAVVGAGAVVLKDVPEGVRVLGIPARPR